MSKLTELDYILGAHKIDRPDVLKAQIKDAVLGLIVDLPLIPHSGTGKVSESVKSVNYELAELRRKVQEL